MKWFFDRTSIEVYSHSHFFISQLVLPASNHPRRIRLDHVTISQSYHNAVVYSGVDAFGRHRLGLNRLSSSGNDYSREKRGIARGFRPNHGSGECYPVYQRHNGYRASLCQSARFAYE
jgi:hypothetical protein